MTAVETASLQEDDDTISLGDLFDALRSGWKAIVLASLAAGIVGAGVAFVLPPIYTARTIIVPPQQQGGTMASALSSLGALAGLAGGAIKSPAEQYVSLMNSVTVTDRIITQFKLQDVYDEEYRVDVRKRLEKNVSITPGKKDGLIIIEVDDKDPQRAAGMANAYVEGLRLMTNTLAVTEAQQRRAFFEGKLSETKDKLTQAQIDLQSSGFNPGALKAEPKSAAEGYAKLRASITAAEVRLQGMQRMLADSAPEVIQLQTLVSAQKAELAKLESSVDPVGKIGGGGDYVTKYREFKYQETLFDLFARQYELARVDESREGALIQVVDVATPPEKKSKPRRGLIILGAATAGMLIGALWVLVRATRVPR